jgi:hypothetical protein
MVITFFDTLMIGQGVFLMSVCDVDSDVFFICANAFKLGHDLVCSFSITLPNSFIGRVISRLTVF